MLHEAVDHVARRGKNVSHIMKHHRAQVVADKRKRQRRGPQFKVGEKDGFTTNGETGGEVARDGLVNAEAPMGGWPAEKEALRQRGKVGIGEWLLHADARGTREDPAALVKLIVAGILHHHAGEIRL